MFHIRSLEDVGKAEAAAGGGGAGEGHPSEGGSPRPSRHRVLDVLLILLLVAALVFIGVTELRRRQAAKELSTTAQKLQELERLSQASGEAVAREVLGKVRRHLVLPEDPAPTVATITNADELKKQNPFYAPAKNGDHLVITRTRAILYDPRQDRILDVVPVQLETPSPSPTASPGVSPSPAPSP